MDRPESDETIDLPAFNDGLRSQIQEGISEVGPDIVVSEDDWDRLQRILVAYVLDAQHWKSWPTAEQLDPAYRVKKRAKALLEAIAAARGSDVRHYLEDAIPAETEAGFNAQLRALAGLNLNSPRVPEEQDKGKGWPYAWEDKSRQRLLTVSEAWWRHVTHNKSVHVKDAGTTPFHRFLKQAYSAIPPEFEPGDSYAAVKRLRAERNKRSRELQMLGRLLEQRLSRD